MIFYYFSGHYSLKIIFTQMYSEEDLTEMRKYFNSLPERSRCEYAVLEAKKLGYGGASCISRELGIDRKTIYKGKKYWEHSESTLPSGRQRQAGVGRKKSEQSPNKSLLISFIDTHKGGSPTNPGVYWISYHPGQIAQMFEAQYCIKVSNGVVKRLLKSLGYGLRTTTQQAVLLC